MLAFSGTVSVNLPSMSVMVPLVVPTCNTLAPITGPIGSTTVPVIVFVCAIKFNDINTPNKKKIFLFIDID